MDENVPLPRINKLPFIIFDALLVLTALALAFSGEGPLTAMRFFWIIFCVAAGGIVACMPFYVEFRTLAKLKEYDLSQANFENARRIEAAMLGIQEIGESVIQQTDRTGDIASRFETLLERMENRIAEISGGGGVGVDRESLQEALREQLDAVRDDYAAAIAEQAALSSDQQHNKLNAALSKLQGLPMQVTLLGELAPRLESLAAMLGDTAAQLVRSAPEPEEFEVEASDETLVEEEEDPEVIEEEGELIEEEQESEAALEDLDDPLGLDEDTGLAEADEEELEEDFDEELDVESELTEEDLEPADEPSPETLAVEEPEGDESAENAESEEGEEPEEAVAESGMGFEDWDDFGEIASADGASEPEEAVAEAAEEEDEPVDADGEPEVAEDEPLPDQPSLMDDLPPASPKGKPKVAKGATTLIAQVLIGIGNKPYVRGTGPGLSETVGVPMEFLEIGKWQWIAPESDEPVSVRIYKNDEEPAEGDPIEIPSGQRRSVAPKFSGGR